MPNAGTESMYSGAPQLCFRALNDDGVSYKYAVMGINNNATVFIGSCGSFNENTGVYVNRTKDNYRGLQQNSNAVYRLNITVNKNMIVIQPEDSNGILYYPIGVIEFTRDDKWNTPASGNSAHCVMNGAFISVNRTNFKEEFQYAFTVPTVPNVANSNYYLITSFGSEPCNLHMGEVTNYHGYSRGIDNAAAEVVVSDGRISRQWPGRSMNLGGKLLGGIKFCNNNAGINGDELIIDSKRYIYNNCNGSSAAEANRFGILIPKE